MIIVTGVWLRRARRSSASIMSSECVRVKQPVNASLTLLSLTSRNSCAFLTDTAESLGMPTENLLTPDVARRLCWEPPDSHSVEAVSAFLSEHGARQWQIDLTCRGLLDALTTQESS